MTMTEPAEPADIESRWPVALTILVVLFLLVALPGRFRLFPVWALYVAGTIVLAPMAAVGLSSAKMRWLRIERAVTLLFVVVAAAGTLTALTYLIIAMIRGADEMHGITLLTSSVALWVSNVLMFSLLYWQIDRGGPGVRASGVRPRPDWLFPQEGAPAEDLPPGWRPTFVDYLFLAFSTATAFSPTDVLPLSPRAKMMMMVESAISLVTIVVVAARAIGELGS
jgi:hypothetical protein